LLFAAADCCFEAGFARWERRLLLVYWILSPFFVNVILSEIVCLISL
jgi:hypothetical protein